MNNTDRAGEVLSAHLQDYHCPLCLLLLQVALSLHQQCEKGPGIPLSLAIPSLPRALHLQADRQPIPTYAHLITMGYASSSRPPCLKHYTLSATTMVKLTKEPTELFCKA